MTKFDIKNQYQVESQSSKGRHTYTVSEYNDNSWACACMNWTRTVPRADCKHILKKKLELQVGFKPVVLKPVLATGGRFFRS
jgi:hypothetical protein